MSQGEELCNQIHGPNFWITAMFTPEDAQPTGVISGRTGHVRQMGKAYKCESRANTILDKK